MGIISMNTPYYWCLQLRNVDCYPEALGHSGITNFNSFLTPPIDSYCLVITNAVNHCGIFL